MLTLYYVMIGVGAVILMLSLFGGDTDGLDVDVDVDVDVDLDAAGEADSASVFSMRTIAAGLASFGIGALLMLENGYGIALQSLAGVVLAVIVGYLTYRLTSWLYGFQGSANISLSGVIGKSGVITIGTARNGTAQLKVSTPNGPREFTCKEVNDSKLKIQDNVKIARKVGNMLLVEKVK